MAFSLTQEQNLKIFFTEYELFYRYFFLKCNSFLRLLQNFSFKFESSFGNDNSFI
jgi:hypothetical protein